MKYDSDEKVTAVVIGGELNGLGVVRSLARQRIPVVVIDAKNSRAALWSRHARSHLVRTLTGPEFVDDMIRLGEEFDRPPILLLTAEEAVHSVSENRDELSKWFRFRMPKDETVKLLSSKANFHDFASRHDFPVPRTTVLENLADLPKLEILRYPCVLKPDDKRNVLSGQKDRALRVDSLSEARERASAMLSTPGGIVAQEWIEGPDSNIYFTLFYRGAEGALAGVFTGRKLSCYPRDVGSTAICVAAPEARQALEPMTLAFAERTGFDGMGSMEYKWDERYKRFVMVEPTVGRTDWQEEIATLCGVNIPVAAYRCELGLPVVVHDQPSRVPTAWRATFVDRAPPNSMAASTSIVDGYFRWDDPLPALKFYGLDHPLRRILRRLRRTNSLRHPEEIINAKAQV
jgi:D-aspartate ligase